MARNVAVASPTWLNSDLAAYDASLAMDTDLYGMDMPTMPPTPPSPFAQLPHRFGGHRPSYREQVSRNTKNDYSSVYSGIDYGRDSMDVMVDDAQLFEHALMGMCGDQQAYLIEELQTGSLKAQMKPKNDAAVQKVQPTKRKSSRAKGARTTNEAVRPPFRPSLCATHPALYNKPPSTPIKHQPNTMLPTPPPEPENETKYQPSQKAMSPPRRPQPLPWKVYTDPNKLLSAEPQFDDPMFRMLKIDVNPDQPKVVSPVFMIGMPCGSLIEAANYYE